MKYLLIAFALSALVVLGCSHKLPPPKNQPPVLHLLWDSLLQAHVTEEGWVDYHGFQRDSARLHHYLKQLSDHHPNQHWSREEQLAYWINAYNAFTIELIRRHYPVRSIRDITWTIPLLHTPWKLKFISIQGVTYSLGDIEHKILRKTFDEPRIHFAINCASYSCPPLLNHAYEASRLESQLQSAAIRFVNDPRRNIITKDSVRVSSLFLWFRGDFTKGGTLKAFLNRYSKTQIGPDQSIKYLKYDWSLNRQ